MNFFISIAVNNAIKRHKINGFSICIFQKILYLCTTKIGNNDKIVLTYPPTRYYYSLAEQVEVRLVCM